MVSAMDWPLVSLIVGLCMTTGGICYQVGCRNSWAEKERLRGTIDKLTTENAGLKHQIENGKQLTEIAERHNKFNADRWADAKDKTDKTEVSLKALEERLVALEQQKAAGAPQADIDRTTLEIQSSLRSALVANSGTNAILSSGPVRLFVVPPHKHALDAGPSQPEEPKTNTPLEAPAEP